MFLPGAAYAVKSPAFHYSQEIFLQKGFHVLQVNYQYNDKNYDNFTIEELSEAIRYDVKTVLSEVLKNSSYDNLYFVAKSLGIIAMSSLLEYDIFKKAQIIWLTPLLQRDDVFDAMIHSENRGLIIIGDNDRCYIKERLVQLIDKSTIVTKLLPNVNHSLKYIHNIIESIYLLKDVLNDNQEFVI